MGVSRPRGQEGDSKTPSTAPGDGWCRWPGATGTCVRMVNDLTVVVPWCSGHHVCFTRRRSPVRSWAESSSFVLVSFMIMTPRSACLHSPQEGSAKKKQNVAASAKGTLRTGFEPVRVEPIGFQVQLLNHSDTAADGRMGRAHSPQCAAGLWLSSPRFPAKSEACDTLSVACQQG